MYYVCVYGYMIFPGSFDYPKFLITVEKSRTCNTQSIIFTRMTLDLGAPGAPPYSTTASCAERGDESLNLKMVLIPEPYRIK